MDHQQNEAGHSAPPSLLDGWLRRAEVAAEIGVSVDTLQRWETRRIGPPCVRIGRKVLCRRNRRHGAAHPSHAQGRHAAHCPACGTNDERALAVMPETNSYRCYAAQISGDCISLYAHIKGCGMYKAAKELQELFGTPTGGRTVPATSPQKPEGRTAPVAQPAPKAFDPEAFAAKLIYNERVEELGISQDDAERLSIGYCSAGFHRDRVCFAIRNPDGSIAGYVGYRAGELKVPSQWITSNVVSLRKRPA